MITAIHGDILTEPVRWQEDIGFLDGGKFHLRHDERFHIAMKDIKFDGVRRKRDKIPGLADNLTIGFGAQMFIGFLGKREFIFLPCHHPFGLVGKDIIIILSADAKYRIFI